MHVLPNGGCPSIAAAVHDFCFRSYAQSFGQSAVAFTLQEFSGFAQDLWRVRAGLTVELGVRYEYVLLPLPQQPNQALDAVFGAAAATSSFPEDRNNFGPRVGLGWAPGRRGSDTGKFGTIRAGYGVYAGRLPGNYGADGIGRYGAAGFGDACADHTGVRRGLPAGGEPGVWVSVRLCDGPTGCGGGDDFGDGVLRAGFGCR